MTIESMGNVFGFIVNCDFCSDYFEVDSNDLDEVIQGIKDGGWEFSKDEKDEWTHKCQICQEKKWKTKNKPRK